MLAVDPKKRITAKQILTDEYFANQIPLQKMHSINSNPGSIDDSPNTIVQIPVSKRFKFICDHPPHIDSRSNNVVQ